MASKSAREAQTMLEDLRKSNNPLVKVHGYYIYSRDGKLLSARVSSTNKPRVHQPSLRRALRLIPRPVFVVTTIFKGQDIGITVTSVNDISGAEKSEICFTVMNNSLMARVLNSNRTASMCLHLLSVSPSLTMLTNYQGASKGDC
jgi:flavin reductase (DIM6/NTAB) family NADH-FMN oxidoreductase RutF